MRAAIITGGVSGIGRGAVELFLREGAQVVAADIQDDNGAHLTDELGPSVSYFHVDVEEEREVEALIAYTVKRYGRRNCLFNNAGLPGVSGPITETSFGEAEASFRVLFWGVVFGMKRRTRHAGTKVGLDHIDRIGCRRGDGPGASVGHLTPAGIGCARQSYSAGTRRTGALISGTCTEPSTRSMR